MKTLLYGMVSLIARVHSQILTLNDNKGWYLTDKQLHFYVIGFVGMFLVFVIHPIFKSLAKKGHILTITWIYVFTLILVLTFAIEIGQGYSGTGAMEFTDIMFGVVGFLIMFAIFAVIRAIILKIVRWIKGKKDKK